MKRVGRSRAYRVNGVQLDEARVSRAIDAGMACSDLYETAKTDILTRADIVTFFETALASYLLPDDER